MSGISKGGGHGSTPEQNTWIYRENDPRWLNTWFTDLPVSGDELALIRKEQSA